MKFYIRNGGINMCWINFKKSSTHNFGETTISSIYGGSSGTVVHGR